MKVMPSSCRWLGIQMGVPPVIIHFFIGFSIHKPSRNWYPHVVMYLCSRGIVKRLKKIVEPIQSITQQSNTNVIRMLAKSWQLL